ncbi:MAG: DHH family phosphoesterase [Thermacetogeniaceae bacterium]|jgi:c-di-AMP phosphodiesterase-like protein
MRMKAGDGVGSIFYRKYKRMLFIGLGVLIVLNSLSLGLTRHLNLGLFAIFIAMLGMGGLAYMDQKEGDALAEEIRADIEAEFPAPNEGPVPDSARLTLALLQVDDYDEVFQGLADDKRPLLVAAVDKYLREWAAGLKAYLRKDGRDRYLALIHAEELNKLEDTSFPVIDQIRQVSAGSHLPVTLSIGVGKGGGEREPALLGRLAQEALDLALERSGDQVVVKSPDHTWFYGGRTEAVGKRSQVRSRVAATELHRLFELCNNVVIMGHRGIDFDVLGAAFALAEAARHYDKKVHIAVDHPGGAVERLLDVIAQREPGLLGDGKEIASGASSQTLLLVVDVHRPSLVAYPPLLSRAGYIGVIDHHRRSEEFLERANIIYLVPSASSASELATELVRYLPGHIGVSPLAATALLAGLIVDTKKFSFATSANTFRNAAWLREAGADPAVIQSLFTDSLDVMLYRARLLQSVEIVHGRFALTMDEQVFPEAQIAASRAADTLLEVNQVEASFALYPTGEGVGISARSRGLMNVQRIMEQIGGGGHFTVAGARLRDAGLQDVRRRLLDILSSEQEERA